MMYRQQLRGPAEDRAALDKFVSELVESVVSDFRAKQPKIAPHELPILKEARKQPVDPVREVRYV